MNKILISISPWNVIWSMGIGKGAPSLYETLKGYTKNGYKVIHFMPYIKNNKLSNEIYNNKKNIIKNNFKIFFLKSKIYYFFYRISKIHHILNILLTPIIYYLYYKEVNNYIKKNKYYKKDIIFYGHSSYGSIISYFLGKKFNKKNIGRYYGTFLKEEYLSKKSIYYYIYFIDILGHKINNTYKIMADDGTKGNIVLNKLGVKKYLFIKNGLISKKKYLNHFKEYHFNIVMSSRIVGWKRIDIAINALNQIKLKNKIKLHIFGDGPLKKELGNLIIKYKLKNNIRFYGSISGNKVLDYIYHSDIFLSTNDISNLSNAFYQAIYYGKSIIATNSGNTSEFLKSNYNGYLVKDYYELANKIEYLIKNKYLLKKFSKHALKISKEKGLISWQNRIIKEIHYINN